MFCLSRTARKKRMLEILSMAVVLGAILTGWMIHSNTVPTLTEFRVVDESLPTAFDGLRIAHVSDLHDAEFGEGHAKTVALLKRAEPDLIFLTGDMVDRHQGRTDVALTLAFAEQAVEIAPCYYVTGNHEAGISPEDYAALEEGLQALGVTVLRDASVTLGRDGQTILIVGVDSPAFGKTGKITENLDAICEGEYTLLLAHHPEYVSAYVRAGADVVFSGHVHGGQFRIPFIGGLYGPGQGWFPAYDKGVYCVSDGNEQTHLVVSRGLGNSSIPVRFANRPEVVTVVLSTDEDP